MREYDFVGLSFGRRMIRPLNGAKWTLGEVERATQERHAGAELFNTDVSAELVG
jgi:hypothetical protein